MIALRHNPPARCLPPYSIYAPSQASFKRERVRNAAPSKHVIQQPPLAGVLGTDAVRLDLIRAIDEYVRDAGITESRFGRDAAGDPRLIYDLRRGRTPRHKTRLQILHYINRAYIDRAAASREGQ